ncbi:MAG TPA: hypothetical protein VHP82_05860 [Gaiellaceae bacterium]|jgi:hypothetical protein|nr:hypothetical protein [Gaiellaceae bacterium]
MAGYTQLNLKDDVENVAERFGLAPDLEATKRSTIALAGSGRVKIEEEVRDVRRWDAIRLAPGVARAFEAGPDGLELLAVGFGDAGDAEMLEEFWAASTERVPEQED